MTATDSAPEPMVSFMLHEGARPAGCLCEGVRVHDEANEDCPVAVTIDDLERWAQEGGVRGAAAIGVLAERARVT